MIEPQLATLFMNWDEKVIFPIASKQQQYYYIVEVTARTPEISGQKDVHVL